MPSWRRPQGKGTSHLSLAAARWRKGPARSGASRDTKSVFGQRRLASLVGGPHGTSSSSPWHGPLPACVQRSCRPCRRCRAPHSQARAPSHWQHQADLPLPPLPRRTGAGTALTRCGRAASLRALRPLLGGRGPTQNSLAGCATSHGGCSWPPRPWVGFPWPPHHLRSLAAGTSSYQRRRR